MNTAAQQTPNPAAISVRALSHSFNGKPILDGVTIDFPERSFIVVLGRSGCGKTTLLKCLAGLLKPAAGEVMLCGLSPKEASLQGQVGFAFQAPTLLPWRDAVNNVLLPLEILGRVNDSAARDYATELLTEVGLGSDLHKYPAELSGGMQQRVSLARALVTRPRFLFLDEPFGALDPVTRDNLNEKLRTISADYHLTVVCVTHSIEEAVFLADHVVIMRDCPVRTLDVMDIVFEEPRGARTRINPEFFVVSTSIRRKGLLP